jgi:RNA polymerase sigma factor (sigma-70 family)
MATKAGERILRAALNAAAGVPLTDGDLLARFNGGEDEAFAALVQRHSGMVLGVCRRLLPTVQDAEDACQATFLVLSRKARSGRWQSSIANWLYTTARRIASKANRAAARRQKREARPQPASSESTLDQMTGREAFLALDEELDKLPALYREPLVLCYLQGLTRDEAAVRLGVPAATLKSQLERGRKKLADALTRRGIVPGAGLLALTATSAARASAPQLVESILAAVGGSPSPAVAALVRGVAMNAPWKYALGLAAMILTIAGGIVFQRSGQVDAQPAAQVPTQERVQQDSPPTRPADNRVPDKVHLLVLGTDGKPVAGATIRRMTMNRAGSSTETLLGKTDAQGRFEAEVLPHSVYSAVVEGAGIIWSGPINSTQDLVLKLPAPKTIKGRLVDLQGKPIARARVTVVSMAATQNDDLTALYNAYRVNPEWVFDSQTVSLPGQATGVPKATPTDADGRFELTGVGLRQVVTLRFDAEGAEAARVVVFADPEFATRMRLPSENEKGMQFSKYRTATYGLEFTHAARPDHLITGVVTDAVSGKPLAGVKVEGTASDLDPLGYGGAWRDTVATVTDAEGKFRLAGLVKAPIRHIFVMGNASASYLDRLMSVKDTAGYTPAEVQVPLLPALRVEGRLVNQVTKQPVAGQVIWLPFTMPENERPVPGSELYFEQANPHPTGLHALAGPDGRFELRVPHAPGVILGRGNQLDPTAQFTPTRVRPEDRKYLAKPDKDPAAIQIGPRERADEEYFKTGRLMSPLRWENGYTILHPEAKATSLQVDVGFDPGARVTLHVTDPEGKPVSGVTVVGPGTYGFRPPTFTGAEIVVGGIDPQGRPVQLYLLHRERKLCAEVKVKGDETGPIAVQLKPCGSVKGRVVDGNGKPIANVRAALQMTDAVADDLLRQKLFRGTSEIATDAEGRFTFPALFPDVEFDVYTTRPGFRMSSGDIRRMILQTGEQKDLGELRLREPEKRDEE